MKKSLLRKYRRHLQLQLRMPQLADPIGSRRCKIRKRVRRRRMKPRLQRKMMRRRQRPRKPKKKKRRKRLNQSQ
jgi:hypothetical protein